MSRSISIYLDLLRFFAALVVLLHHAFPILFPNFPLPFPGHHAVILFFFVSGFVIEHVGSRPGTQLNSYTVDRLSRLLSVSVPALALGLVVTLAVGEALAPLPAARHLGEVAMPPEQAFVRFAANVFFAGQLWFVDQMAPLNGVFWSLNYEFMYYIVYAAWRYARPGWNVVLPLVVLLVAGPRIVLLFPCWLAGVVVYRNLHRWKMAGGVATALFWASALAYLVVFWIDLPVSIRDQMDRLWPAAMRNLGASRSFVGDYLLTLLFAANCVAFASMTQAWTRWTPRVERLAKLGGGYTYSIYAFHTPLLALAVLALAHQAVSPARAGLALLAILLGCVGLAMLTEHQRGWVRLQLQSLLRR